MILADRFVMHPTQKQTLAQLECPVYIHCSRRCRDKKSGTNFVQVRMVNCSERLICDVYLRIEGYDRNGETVYVRNDVVLPNCNAVPCAVFGEDRIISLGMQEASWLCITVERVCFADGMLWRRLPGHKLTDIRAWKSCSCGMRNHPKSAVCVLCKRNLAQPEIKKHKTLRSEPMHLLTPVPVFDPPVPINRPEPIVRPAPIVRQQMPQKYPPVQEKKKSRKLKITLIVLLLLAVTAAAGLLLYTYRDYLLR